MTSQRNTLGLKMVGTTLVSALLAYICMQRDWALVFIPILLAIAILLPAQHNLRRKLWISIGLHLAVSYFAFGTGAALLWIDLGFIMSLTGFSIMSVFTGMLIYLCNGFIINYKQFQLSKIVLGIIGFAIIPFIANEIASLSKFFNVFWIFLFFWQVLLGGLIGTSINISTKKIERE